MSKKIIVLHTGGTISMEEDQDHKTVKTTSEHPFAHLSYAFDEDIQIHMETIFMVPSPHISPQHMLTLSKRIVECASLGYQGVVVTHGTDTLEETAYFLDLTIHLNIPVVVTGAMRSSNELGSDALYNIISSIRVATSDEAAHKGILVVMNDEIHTAKSVTKTHTSNVATFQSPQSGPIGTVTKRSVDFHRQPINLDYYSIQQIDREVVILKAFTGMDHVLFDALIPLNIHGVVLEAFGQGNVPPTTIPAIKRLIEKKIPIVLVSRCFNGIVQDVYDYDGGGKQLKDLGVIFSNGLNGQKARLKLLVLLSSNVPFEELQKHF